MNTQDWSPLGLTSLILEKEMATHSSTLAWKIPWMEEPGRLQSMGSWRVGHDWATSLSLFTFMHWRRKWQPTPVFLPRESQGQRSLVVYSPWCREELDTTERLDFHFSLSCIGEENGNPLQYSYLENPRDGGAWWAPVYGVTQSQTPLKRLSSSSSRAARTYRLGKLLGDKNKTLCAPGHRRREQWPHKGLTQTCLSLWWRRGSGVACYRVRGTKCGSACTGHFVGGRHYLHHLYHSLVSSQTTGREHRPSHQ